MDLKSFIRIYDDSIPKETCVELIDFFEKNKDIHQRIENQKKPNFTQLNLTENLGKCKVIAEVHDCLVNVVFSYKKNYYNALKECLFPSKHSFEQFRIKKYNNDGNDLFDTHVDVMDYSSARRFLSFFWYLNDVNNGGETVFGDLSIKPKAGRLVIFPPLWMFPHKGNIPKSSEKYLLSTYLHYM